MGDKLLQLLLVRHCNLALPGRFSHLLLNHGCQLWNDNAVEIAQRDERILRRSRSENGAAGQGDGQGGHRQNCDNALFHVVFPFACVCLSFVFVSFVRGAGMLRSAWRYRTLSRPKLTDKASLTRSMAAESRCPIFSLRRFLSSVLTCSSSTTESLCKP